MHEGSEVARWERWENSEVARSKRWEGSEAASWKGGREIRWQGGRFLVLFNGGGCIVSLRFYLFISDVNQRNKGADCVQDILAWLEELKDSPLI